MPEIKPEVPSVASPAPVTPAPAKPVNEFEGYKTLQPIRINTNEKFPDVVAFVDVQKPDGEVVYNLRVRISKFKDKENPEKLKYWVTPESRKGANNKFREVIKMSPTMYRYCNGPLIEQVLAKKANPLQGQKVEITMEALKVHTVLHGTAMEYKATDGKTYPIEMTKKQNIRVLNMNGVRFMVQNPNTKSKYATMAREGHKITWITQGEDWLGRIEDGKFI